MLNVNLAQELRQIFYAFYFLLPTYFNEVIVPCLRIRRFFISRSKFWSLLEKGGVGFISEQYINHSLI